MTERLRTRKVIANGVRVMVIWGGYEESAVGVVESSRVHFDSWGDPTCPAYTVRFPWGVHESISYEKVWELPKSTEV